MGFPELLRSQIISLFIEESINFLCPYAIGGVCLSLTRRDKVKRSIEPLWVFFFSSRILGWMSPFFSSFDFPSLTSATHLCPPGLGELGLSTCLADDILRQQNGVVVADEAITGSTHPLPTLRTPGLRSQTQNAERPGVSEGVAEVLCAPK